MQFLTQEWLGSFLAARRPMEDTHWHSAAEHRGSRYVGGPIKA